ncbi:MAG: hypothetical protein PW788_09635 [Micavibrio sp.]|nr:hypothetical protein [Micavibrio sp.]
MSADFIDYIAEPATNPSAGLTVDEFKPYKGLEPFFTKVMELKTTPSIRNSLTVMLLELDSGLTAFDAGNREQAVRHHENMLNTSRTVFKQQETLTGKSAEAQAAGGANVYADVQKMFTDITSAARETANTSEKPWARSLQGVVEEFKARRDAQKNLSLMPEQGYRADAPVFLASPRHTLRETSKFDIDFTKASEPATVAWSRPEYRNLGTVLEQMARTGQPARVEAMVALSSLRNMNAKEVEFLKDMRNGKPNDGEKNKSFRDSHKRLDAYVEKLLANDKVGRDVAGSLARWHKPASDYAKRFERISQGPGVLSKIFHSAASFLARIAKTPEQAAKKAPAAPQMKA